MLSDFAFGLDDISLGDSSIGFSSSIIGSSFFGSSALGVVGSVFRAFSVFTATAFLTILFRFAGTSGVDLLDASACSSKIA